MSVKKFLLYVLAVFLLLMLNFGAVYGYAALTSSDGFPTVGPAESTVATGLLAVELLLWWLIDYRRNRQAYELPAAAPARRDVPSDEAIRSLDRHSLRSGAGHPAQRVRPKQIFLPIAGVLAFAAVSYAAIYFGFHFLVFNVEYHGDPAVFGDVYRGATVVTNRYDREFNRGVVVLRTTDGKQHTLVFDGSDLHPGRYRCPPTEFSSDPGPGGIVLNLHRNFWAETEITLMMIFPVIVWGLSVFLSRRIEPKEPEEKAAGAVD